MADISLGTTSVPNSVDTYTPATTLTDVEILRINGVAAAVIALESLVMTTMRDLVLNSITNSAGGVLRGSAFPSSPVDGQLFFRTDQGLLYVFITATGQWEGGASIPAGSIGTVALSDLAVTTAKLSDLAVTTAKLSDLAVTTAKLSDLAVTTAKLSDLAVTTAKLSDLAVTTQKIALGAITDALIAATGITTRTKLPAQIAYKDEANTFTGANTFSNLIPRMQNLIPLIWRDTTAVDRAILYLNGLNNVSLENPHPTGEIQSRITNTTGFIRFLIENGITTNRIMSLQGLAAVNDNAMNLHRRLRFFNTAAIFFHELSAAPTANRTSVLPDVAGTVAVKQAVLTAQTTVAGTLSVAPSLIAFLNAVPVTVGQTIIVYCRLLLSPLVMISSPLTLTVQINAASGAVVNGVNSSSSSHRSPARGIVFGVPFQESIAGIFRCTVSGTVNIWIMANLDSGTVAYPIGAAEMSVDRF